MSKNDDEIREDLAKIEKKIENAIDSLGEYDNDIVQYIAEIVSSVCNVDIQRMLSNDRMLPVVHARWLYWYAYRSLTKHTYGRISEDTSQRCTKKYTEAGVGIGINKMSAMIDQDPVWRKRWGVVKRVVKLINEEEEGETFNSTITIQVPKELRDKITFKIQEV